MHVAGKNILEARANLMKVNDPAFAQDRNLYEDAFISPWDQKYMTKEGHKKEKIKKLKKQTTTILRDNRRKEYVQEFDGVDIEEMNNFMPGEHN